MFKPFYVHENVGPGKLSGRSPRGFTLKVSPDPDNTRHVIVQGTWCSNKDEFCKRVGRANADAAEAKSINKRQLPELAARMAGVVRPDLAYGEGYYYYLLKYVV